MSGEDLARLLCRLEPGMSLIVPDAWLDRTIPGSLAERVARIREIAEDYGCIWHQGIGEQRFEKEEIPATG